MGIEPNCLDGLVDVHLNRYKAAEGWLGGIERKFDTVTRRSDCVRQAQRGRLIGGQYAAGEKT